ncbi:MAG: hypothetical protein Ta2B_27930 [Termitinemataceae bacterium]|nr:MAG: hypothetical protein Ta2B_27930 [Termitinemataceae bacterium]
MRQKASNSASHIARQRQSKANEYLDVPYIIVNQILFYDKYIFLLYERVAKIKFYRFSKFNRNSLNSILRPSLALETRFFNVPALV